VMMIISGSHVVALLVGDLGNRLKMCENAYSPWAVEDACCKSWV